MSLNAKYEYYLNRYLEGEKENDLPKKAFQLFARNLPPNETESAKLQLSDHSDIPNYGVLLLDFEKTDPSWKNNELPYDSPYKEEIDNCIQIANEIQKHFLSEIKNDEYTKKVQFKNFFKLVYSLLVLESSELEVFKKSTSDIINFNFDLHLDKLKKKAREICDTTRPLYIYGGGLIDQIENHYKLDGYHVYSKNGKRYYSRDMKEEYIFPHSKYLIIDNFVGKIKTVENGTTVFKSNPEAIEVIFNLLKERELSFYEHVRHFYKKYDFDAYGKRVIHLYLTESGSVTRELFRKYPEVLMEFTKVRDYIKKTYNQINNASLDSTEVQVELKTYQNRYPIVNEIIDQLQKNIFGLTKNELELVADYLAYFEKEHDFHYFLPKRPRTEENLIKYTGTLVDFANELKKIGTTSSELKLHITYLNNKEDYVRELLNQTTTSYETLRKNFRTLLSSNDLLILPDYLLDKIFDTDSDLSNKRTEIATMQQYL
ncbi:MAG: hypothetical protein K9L74_01875 [Candidatus Izimaplasma sp.]|nr:hypothetical protein [Candidatus Izimaplasma bacterium]